MKRVLIVDDVAEIRRLVRLTIGSHEVHESASAEEALSMLIELGGVDVLILDIMMVRPRDGLALLSAVRNHREWKRTRVVILTARDTHEDRAAARALAVDAYFTKPFSPQAVGDCVESLLRELPVPSPSAGHGHQTGV